MKNDDLSKVNIIKLQKKISPLNNSNTKLSKLDDELRLFDSTGLTETEKYVIELFRRVASIHLTDDPSTPFIPRMQLASGARTCMPEDITNNELNFFISILDNIINLMLKARIADILWQRKYKKNPDFPRITISIYLSIDFTEDRFFENLLFWKRGLNLSFQINDKAALETFSKKLLDFINNTPFLCDACFLRLVELLRIYNLSKNEDNKIIEKITQWGELLEKENNWVLAEQYYNEAANWALSKQKDSDKYTELQVKRVNAYSMAAQKSDSGIVAGANYESALRILRILDKKKREKYFSEEAELELKYKIKESGKNALSEMKETSLTFNISEEIKIINENIKGKDKDAALKNFTYLIGHISASKIEEDAIHFITSSPLLSMMGHTVFGSDGRIISRTNGLNSFENLSMEKPEVWNNMVWHYMMFISLVVQSAILPALQIIRCEHNIQLFDLIEIVRKSNIIPIDRVEVFAKGLYAGFNSDFITSLHLLVPQIENMVRVHLQDVGVKTSIIENTTSIEQEKGLSNLVIESAFYDIFGKDLGFEIKALFCDASGPNLRNNIAHGLFNQNEMKSVYSVYCWWFCFKLVYINFYDSKVMGKEKE